MRRLIQQACDPAVLKVLNQRAAKVTAGADAAAEWKSFGRLKAYGKLRDCLMQPLGQRLRCSYCSDSKAADVEHFRPKSAFPEATFDFDNYLLVCPECNRKKNAAFPFDDNGHPQIINPLFDDPWDSLFFAPTTGYLDARILDASGKRSPKGEKTLEAVGSILNGSAVLLGRKRSWVDVMSRLEAVLEGSIPMGQSQFSTFEDVDDYGLSEWLLNREGKDLPSVLDLREPRKAEWRILRDLPRGP